jgi:hypothetical protein
VSGEYWVLDEQPSLLLPSLRYKACGFCDYNGLEPWDVLVAFAAWEQTPECLQHPRLVASAYFHDRTPQAVGWWASWCFIRRPDTTQ